MDRLTAYDWPGNVRELENVLERAIILTSGPSLQLAALQLGADRPARPTQASAQAGTLAETPATGTMREFEQAHILRVCERTGWKIKGTGGAAELLGLNPGTLFSRMRKLGIRRP